VDLAVLLNNAISYLFKIAIASASASDKYLLFACLWKHHFIFALSVTDSITTYFVA
jgi:hypothetical protein